MQFSPLLFAFTFKTCFEGRHFWGDCIQARIQSLFCWYLSYYSHFLSCFPHPCRDQCYLHLSNHATNHLGGFFCLLLYSMLTSHPPLPGLFFLLLFSFCLSSTLEGFQPGCPLQLCRSHRMCSLAEPWGSTGEKLDAGSLQMLPCL